MKIDSIHIQHFGHFANFDLSFGDEPLALLCGQNEAGKTTLLEFLRQLLFGFPERSPYNFGEGGELGGSAQLTLADQRRVDLKRRKGRKNTVQARVSGRDAELDDAAFRQLLSNANENIFKSVFAFGLDELRAGNEGLKDESLQSALFGGGLGGALNPEALLKELDDDASKIFKPSGNKQTIALICSKIADLAKSKREKLIRPDEYEKREQAWKETQQEAARLATALSDLRRKKDRLERLAGAFPRWRRLQSLRGEREKLVVSQLLPPEAEHQFTTATAAIQRLTAEIDGLQLDSAATTRELESLELDRTLLPLRSEIEDCHRLIQSVADARRDLPVLRGDCERLREEIASELDRLRPGWTLDDLKSFSVSSATAHAFEQLCERRSALDEEHTRLEIRKGESQSAVRQKVDDWGAIGEVPDVSKLVDVVEQSSEYFADQKALKRENDEHAELTRGLELQQARLSPPLKIGSTLTQEAVQRLPVPPRELVVRFDQEYRELQQRCSIAQESLAEAEKKEVELQTEWSNLTETTTPIPSVDDLKQHRKNRDSLWQSVRESYLDRPSEIAPPAIPAAYETAVRAADQLADQIYGRASDVAKKEQLRRRVAEAKSIVQRRREECGRLEMNRADFARRWSELWRRCGFEPLDADLMVAWVDSFLAFVDAREALLRRETEAKNCQSRIAAFEAKCRHVLQSPTGTIKALVAAAKLQVKYAEGNAQLRKSLERDRKQLDKQLIEIERGLERWKESNNMWGQEWKKLLADLGLPVDWDTVLARSVLGELRTTHEKLANLGEIERRVVRMEERIAEFDPRVRRVCEQLGEIAVSGYPEVTAQALHERLAQAAKIQERRANLENKISAGGDVLQKKQVELKKATAERDQWLARVQAASDEIFVETAKRARQATELDQQIRELNEQLTIARGDTSDEEFRAQLETADLVTLENELVEMNAALEQQESAVAEAREAAGGLRRKFEELDGRDEAVLIQEELARQQARLLTEVHRYVPLVFARQLLQAAIKRFESNNQPALISDISRLLAVMTGGRYVEIERPSSDRSALYVRHENGSELTPEQLSTGVREQLYLAIRLGYVLHYCGQAEPLPIVMDDVLVNLDDDRARSTLEALREVAQRAQILFFTCHPHVVDLVTQVFPSVQPQYLPSGEQKGLGLQGEGPQGLKGPKGLFGQTVS